MGDIHEHKMPSKYHTYKTLTGFATIIKFFKKMTNSSNPNISELQQHLIRMLTPIMYALWRYWGYPSVFNNFRTGLRKFGKVRSSVFLSFLTQPFGKGGSGT
jgi:hypothetical protein